jgi:hypothetical protein
MGLKLAVFGMRLIVYLLPLGIGLSLTWGNCGRYIWAENSMRPVEAVLTKAERYGTPPYSKGGAAIEVEYLYTYGNNHYVGKNFAVCYTYSSGSIYPIVEMYNEIQSKVGANVSIWVDPSNPEASVLYKYLPTGAILLICFFLLVGLLVLRKFDVFLTRLLVSHMENV